MIADYNYPLIKNEWDFTERDFLSYLSYFPVHTISLSMNSHTLTSKHGYNDFLLFQVSWDIINENLVRENLSNQNTYRNFQNINFINDTDIVRNPKVEVIRYSKPEEYLISDEVKKRFSFLLKMNKGVDLTQGKIAIESKRRSEEYQHLEYNVSYSVQEEKIKMPDSFFTDLQQRVNNYIAFENYLNELQ